MGTIMTAGLMWIRPGLLLTPEGWMGRDRLVAQSSARNGTVVLGISDRLDYEDEKTPWHHARYFDTLLGDPVGSIVEQIPRRRTVGPRRTAHHANPKLLARPTSYRFALACSPLRSTAKSKPLRREYQL